MNEFQGLIEKILRHFAGDQFRDELIQAKRFFFENTGALDEHTESFEMRMSQFYDWYFFSRDLTGYGRTPLEVCQQVRELRFSEEENQAIEILRKNRHSLFELIKIKNEDIYIRDLFKNKKLVVRKSPWFIGFEPEEIFEARLFPVKDNFVFSKGFCFHPPSARKYILDEIDRHKKDADLDPEEIMLRLIKMRYKFDQYRHVPPDMIYSNERMLKI